MPLPPAKPPPLPPARLTAHDKPEAKAQANVPAPHFELHPARRSLR
jgi:hypothetical protein